MDYSSDNRSLYQAITPFLQNDEEILWAGRPGKVSAPQTPFLVLFAIFWIGFAVFWTVSATAMGAPFGLIGIFFIAFGVFFFGTALFGQKKLLQTTVYAVTDRRAIIVTQGKSGADCTEYIFANLPNISLESVNGNTGTIRFVERMPYYDHHHRRYRTSYSSTWEVKTAFLQIDGVQSVYRMISERLGR